MKKYKSILYSSRFLIVFTLTSVSIIGISANLPSKRKQDDTYKRLAKLIETININDLKLINRTSAFNIISKEKDPEGNVRLILRNDYNKSITAYEVSIGSTRTMIDTFFSMHDESIRPGQSKEELLAINIDPELEKKGIVILAVIFEDGTTDGSLESIKDIQDYRLGEKMQMDHILSLSDEALNTPTDEMQRALNKIKTNMLTMPEASAANLSMFVKFGIDDTRGRMSRYVENVMNNNNGNTTVKFAKFMEYIKEKSLMLNEYSKAIKLKDQ